MAEKKSTSIATNIFWLASLLFFISGGTGLVYQVVWFKRFSHVWGSTSLAFAAVGASFLFGLGLGAYLLGRFSDRVLFPLRWYGICELAIGVLAMIIPFEIAALVNASVGLYARIPEEVFLRFMVQSLITLLVIGPPCVLMGGTLPLLIRQLTSRDGSLDEATGWLYAINTFGAATGCYLAGFHIIPSLGLLWTNNLAAMVNIAIGVVSILVSTSIEQRMTGRARTLPTTEPAAPNRLTFALVGLYLATTLSGCGALILEMTWTRQLALVLGGSTYAFTATLFVVLVGIALGSMIFHLQLRNIASQPIVPIVVVGILVLSVGITKALLPQFSELMGSKSVREWRGFQFPNALLCVGVSGLLEFIPAVAMGILFPLFVHLTHASAARVGRAVGNIYAWNTAGSIVGASLTAVLLFPTIGTAGAIALATAMYLVSLLAVIPWTGWKPITSALATAAGGAAIVVWILQPTDPRYTNLGFYMYGDTAQAKSALGEQKWLTAVTPLFYKEGASSNVFVSEVNNLDLSLRVNGKVDASNGADMVTQLGLAYFPRMFKHDAKNVLVIGFGSGCTSGRSLEFPDTNVTCCEIEPAVYSASEQFATFNGRPQEKSRAWLEAHNASLPEKERMTPEQIDEQARFSMIFGDGRTAIQGSSQKYDLIISEPSNPWLAGVSNLFTKEFFRSAKEHLTDNGVLAQWIQTYSFTLSDYLMIVRTLRSEFPHYGVVMMLGGIDTVLLASKEPLLPTLENVKSLQRMVDASPAISNDFQTWFGGTDIRWLLMEHYSLGKDQLDRLVDHDKNKELNTDLHLRLEFDAPLHLFQNLPQDETATVGLLKAADRRWSATLAKQFDVKIDTVDFQLAQAQYLLRQAGHPKMAAQLRKLGQLERVATHYEAAKKLDPKSVEAQHGLARVRLLQERKDDAIEALRQLIQMAPDNASAHGELAQELLTKKQFAEATAEFREALRLQPKVTFNDATFLWANNLAWILATNADAKLRNGAEAVRWAKAVCDADKNKQPALLDTLAAALAEAGDFEGASKVAQQVIDTAADSPQLVTTMKARLKLYQASQPYRE